MTILIQIWSEINNITNIAFVWGQYRIYRPKEVYRPWTSSSVNILLSGQYILVSTSYKGYICIICTCIIPRTFSIKFACKISLLIFGQLVNRGLIHKLNKYKMVYMSFTVVCTQSGYLTFMFTYLDSSITGIILLYRYKECEDVELNIPHRSNDKKKSSRYY